MSGVYAPYNARCPRYPELGHITVCDPSTVDEMIAVGATRWSCVNCDWWKVQFIGGVQ